MSAENKEMLKRVRGQISRRYVDASMVNVHVSGGVVTLTGIIRHLRTYPNVELREEMEQISKILRSQSGIREVVWDVTIRL